MLFGARQLDVDVLLGPRQTKLSCHDCLLLSSRNRGLCLGRSYDSDLEVLVKEILINLDRSHGRKSGFVL